jgi:hypothetical protein
MLLVGALGSSACIWWMSSIDNFTPKEDLSVMLAAWGGFVGLFPPVFLTDEVEVLDPRDGIYGGALAVVCLVIPLVLVPSITHTAVSEFTDRAVDAQRQNLREDRPVVREVAAALADDYRQRGATPAEAQELAGVALGASVKIQSAARGVSHGLRFLSLTMAVFGGVIALLRWLAPSPTIHPVTR